MGLNTSLPPVKIADLADGTDGELITWDASGNPAAVSTGTATHVLTSNGAGAAPTFQAAAGGSGQTLYDHVVAASGGDYTTLGAAITAASSGDTIFVRSGTYSESAISSATTNLTIIGENSETSVISMTTNNFSLTGADVCLRGINITASTGTVTIGGANAEVTGCQINKSGNGGCSFDGASMKISGNQFITTQTDDSYHFRFTGNFQSIVNNYFSTPNTETTATSGTIFLNGTSQYFSNNVIVWSGSGAGIMVNMTGSAGSFNNNLFSSGANSGTALKLDTSGNCCATGNTIRNYSAAIVIDAVECAVSGNNLYFNKDGINVTAGGKSVISGNMISGAGTTSGQNGIDVSAAIDNIVITGNSIYNQDVGVNIAASTNDNCVIVGNSITGCTTAISDSGTGTITASSNATS